MPNARGVRPGIFGLANGLARGGHLTDADRALWRASNDWFDAAYVDPASVDPTLFDKQLYPVVTCWFWTSAVHLIERVPPCLAMLNRYGVEWVELRSDDPGRVLYADADQVVCEPYPPRPAGRGD